MSDGKVTDVLGVKPWGEAVNKAVASTADGVSAFLSRICLPAAEEFGLFLRDRVHIWRTANLAAVVSAAERKLGDQAGTAHPRIVARVIEEGSWINEPGLQDLWGGLLASSCTDEELDDSNLLFLDLLSGLTAAQARVLHYGCEASRKFLDVSGLPLVFMLEVTRAKALEIAGTNDVNRLDRELDALRNTGLLTVDAGVIMGSRDVVRITPSPLALHLFVRCQGSRSSPSEYFGIVEVRRLMADKQQYFGTACLEAYWEVADPNTETE